jgi:hypothetical protein
LAPELKIGTDHLICRGKDLEGKSQKKKKKGDLAEREI